LIDVAVFTTPVRAEALLDNDDQELLNAFGDFAKQGASKKAPDNAGA
jgi:hypothetical protein